MRIACRIGHRRTGWLALAVLVVSAGVSLGCAASGLSGLGASAAGAGVALSAILGLLSASSSLGGCDCGYQSRKGGDADVDADTDTPTNDTCLDYGGTDSDTDTDSDTYDVCLNYGCLDYGGTDTGTDSDTDTDTETETDADAGPDAGTDAGFYCLLMEPHGEPQFSRAPDRERARRDALDRLANGGTLPADLAERVRRLRGKKG